ncbi:hypothetical protein GJAV_G00196900 [Gymnothorax javanicus]|nr:hypothetical protein GJAV_G00196900 [Gymnothorax javanicus]
MRYLQFLKFASCCVSIFILWKIYPDKLSYSARGQNHEFLATGQLVCERLWRKYASLKSLTITDTEEFTNDITKLMICPRPSNVTLRERYRVELHSCCNATEELILTKRNTMLGENIHYDAELKTKVVDDSLLKMFPENMPWKTADPFRSCTVVGNGGILKNSSCGSMIDKADFVIRINLGPTNYSTDVGVKTNMITANPSQIERSYPNLMRDPRPLADKMSGYGNPPLIMSAFAFQYSTPISFRVHRALHPQHQVVFFNPKYLGGLHGYWKERGQKSFRLSSGLIMTSVALELCEEVHLYGFWPFYFDLSQRPLTNHYFDDIRQQNGYHHFSVEFLQLLNMHRMGVINLHIGQCQ